MTVELFQSPFALFFFYIFSGMGILLFHNWSRNAVTATIINLYFLLFVGLFIHGYMAYAVFILGSIAFGLIDAAYVYLKKWRYNTKNGYCYWIGAGWSYVTLIVHQLLTASNVFIVFLLLIALILVVLFRVKNVIPHLRSEKILFPLLLLVGFVFPKLFLVSFGIGVITEICAVEIFHTWRYAYPSYVQIGLGYAALLTFAQIVVEIFQKNASPFHLGAATGIAALFFIKGLIYARQTKDQV